MNAFFSLYDYRQWHWLWTPFFPPQTGLFLVRYPGDLLQITLPRYQDLMKLRLQSLMQDWMAGTSASPQETHQLLCQTLAALDPRQEPPKLQADLQIWQTDWADGLIEMNETFFQQLSRHMERNFPFRLHPPIPSEQAQLRSLYQQMMLPQWLNELTKGR